MQKPVLLKTEAEIESAKRDGFGDVIAKREVVNGVEYWMADPELLALYRERQPFTDEGVTK